MKNKKKGQPWILLDRIDKRRRKKKRLSATIWPLYVVTRHPMWKRIRGHIQGDGRMLGLAIGCHHTLYLDNTDTTHSLEYAEHELTTFLIKKQRNQHEISKQPLTLLIAQKISVKVHMYPQMQTWFFGLLSYFKCTWMVDKPTQYFFCIR